MWNGTRMSIVWSALMDQRYTVQVVRDPGETHTGQLEIWDGDERLMQAPVLLSYGAVFGPDISDIHEWQTMAIDFMDQRAIASPSGDSPFHRG